METKQETIKIILKSSFEAGACHIGSALSCVDIILDIFDKKKDNDIFLFTKASGVAAFYAVLALKGYFPVEKVAEYLKQYPLANKAVPGVLHSVGSVGMGLSVAVGLALSDRSRNVYCLISDGQLDEGVTYEAALFSKQHNLTNLYVIVDNNSLQACGKTNDILNLDTAIDFYNKTFPHFENRITIKGGNIPFLANQVSSHYCNLSEGQLIEALKWI
jgi:transketolase